jgi:hypothetical protein
MVFVKPHSCCDNCLRFAGDSALVPRRWTSGVTLIMPSQTSVRLCRPSSNRGKLNHVVMSKVWSVFSVQLLHVLHHWPDNSFSPGLSLPGARLPLPQFVVIFVCMFSSPSAIGAEIQLRFHRSSPSSILRQWSRFWVLRRMSSSSLPRSFKVTSLEVSS